MAVAFGKIAKAISDLISHINNKKNPHEVTKTQIGLENVDNTADANKTVKAALTATKFDALKNFSLTGDVTGSASFDGSGDISLSVTVTDVSNVNDGVLKIANGGTGANTAASALNNLGAAPKEHSHSNYVTTTTMNNAITTAIGNAVAASY